MFFLCSYLREEKEIKIGNYDALLIKAFTATNEYGVRKDAFWTIRSNS